LAASSIARAAGDGRAAGRAVGVGLAFFGVAFLGEAAGDSAGEGDAAFSAGEGDAAGDSAGLGD